MNQQREVRWRSSSLIPKKLFRELLFLLRYVGCTTLGSERQVHHHRLSRRLGIPVLYRLADAAVMLKEQLMVIAG